MNEGSGFVLRRLVVRRAEDSFLREMYGTKAENEGKRRGRLEGGRIERKIDMALLWKLSLTPASKMARIWLKKVPICRLNVG